MTKNYNWDLSSLFSNTSSCKEFISKALEDTYLQPLMALKDSNLDTSEQLCNLLDLYYKKDLEIERAHTYADLCYSSDMNDETNEILSKQASFLYNNFSEKTSWIFPKILKISQDKLEEFARSPILIEYKEMLLKLLSQKEHILSDESERIISLMSSSNREFYRTFSLLTDVESSFEDAIDSNSNKHPVNTSTYCNYIKHPDRALRQSAFKSMSKYLSQINKTLATLLFGHIKAKHASSKIRKYDSVLNASLEPNFVNTSVYYGLIEAFRKNIHISHKFFKMKKDILDIDNFSTTDYLAPIFKIGNVEIEFEESVEIMLKSLHYFGEEYINTLEKGIKEDGWADIFPKKGKRSGAFSSGSYKDKPFMLLNSHNSLYDVMVLTHESGHSMHSYLSWKHQNYCNSSYSIFIAEIASTVNELLLADYIIKSDMSSDVKKYAIQQHLEMFQSTLARQTMFAEFELLINKQFSDSGTLSSEFLNKEYLQLVKDYLGPHIEIKEDIKYEWSRIPHFYYNFYVYQYATGVCIAQNISSRIISQEEGFVEKYLKMLSEGGRLTPEEVLSIVDIDISTPKFIEDAMIEFEKSIDLAYSINNSSKEELTV